MSWSPDGRKITCGGSRGKFNISKHSPSTYPSKVYRLKSGTITHKPAINIKFLQDNFINAMPKGKYSIHGKVYAYSACLTEETENQFWQQTHITA